MGQKISGTREKVNGLQAYRQGSTDIPSHITCRIFSNLVLRGWKKYLGEGGRRTGTLGHCSHAFQASFPSYFCFFLGLTSLLLPIPSFPISLLKCNTSKVPVSLLEFSFQFSKVEIQCASQCASSVELGRTRVLLASKNAETLIVFHFPPSQGHSPQLQRHPMNEYYQ